MFFNEYPVRPLVMRIHASQCLSLLLYPVTLYWQSFWGGIRCNIDSFMCVQHWRRFVFNGSGLGEHCALCHV